MQHEMETGASGTVGEILGLGVDVYVAITGNLYSVLLATFGDMGVLMLGPSYIPRIGLGIYVYCIYVYM